LATVARGPYAGTRKYPVYETRNVRARTAVTRWSAGSWRQARTMTSESGRKKNDEYARLRTSTAGEGSGSE